MKLVIAKDLTLPRDVVTQVIAILAKRRAGKSYTMRRIVEQLLGAGEQVVMVDPKGDQWGIRSSADGKKPGYPVLILGGEHGDLPLEAGGGEVVAKLVAEERVSVLIDLSQFRKHEVATFMTAFLENLYRLKAQEKYRTPMTLVVDEADAIAPQKPQKGEERMLGAIEDIVRRGGQRGIGCYLVSQRSAVLNKNVLTQAQILVVLRTIAPQDLAAMKAWIDVHGSAEEGRTLMESLPSLPVGDAWFWSPGWPTDTGIFKRVHVSPIETFDSGATPKPGEKRVIPRNLADVDLEALKGQMAAVVEKAKASDPKKLQAEVARLTRELEAERKKPQVVNPTKIQKITVPTVGKKTLEALRKVEANIKTMLKKAKEHGIAAAGVEGAVVSAMGILAAEMKKVEGQTYAEPTKPMQTPPKFVKVDPVPMREAEFKVDVQVAPGDISGKPRDLLEVLTSRYPEQLTRPQAALLARIKTRASTFRNCVSKLKGMGLIETPGDNLVATAAGMAYLGASPKAPETAEEVRARWRSTFAGETLRMFDMLLQYPTGLERSTLAGLLEMNESKSTFRNCISKLRVSGVLVDNNAGLLAPAQHLF